MQYFNHEKLDVYQTAIEFIVIIELIVKQFPKERAYLVDQLQRASLSVALNIAEGSGEFSENEKIRFYRMARRSATECAGIMHICTLLKLVDERMGAKSRGLLLRIVSMLTKMVNKSSETQTQNANVHGNEAAQAIDF